MILLSNADARHIPLADQSVHCIVTSPPYFGLRDYGTGKWIGGDPECDHKPEHRQGQTGERSCRTQVVDRPFKFSCKKCGAVRIDKQLGLESLPEHYAQNMVGVFREVRRVLRDDGTCWINLGDSYNGSGGAGGDYAAGGLKEGQPKYPGRHLDNLKPKDLIGIPWRVAFALQADGWYLRSDIIWHKPNPMPESVRDRPTKAHEYIFLLTKSARYYYDYEAVKEDLAYSTANDGRLWRPGYTTERPDRGYPGENSHGAGMLQPSGVGRNKRSVWTVSTKPYPGSHYATFPPGLIEPCILAGCPEAVCAECGAPYERVVERGDLVSTDGTADDYRPKKFTSDPLVKGRSEGWTPNHRYDYKTLGYQPTCDCDAGTKPGVVLDPFAGSGTTLMVARKHGRNGIGLDLSFEYLTTNARERLVYGGFVPVADGVQQLTIEA